MIEKSSHRNIAEDCCSNSRTCVMMYRGASIRALSSASLIPSNAANAESFEREPPTVSDPDLHHVWSSRVESTMEMSLGDFIDPAHQGGHTHGRVFGNRKL
jgi:hypothetical protein